MSPVVFNRHDYARDMADQLIKPTALQLQARSGVFLYGIRRIGKTTFLQQDLIPALKARGALVIYLDLWADRSRSPLLMVNEAVRATLKELASAGSRLLRSLSSVNVSTAGLSFNFQLDSLGTASGATLAQAFTELIDKTQTDVVLILDEVQHAAGSEEGVTLMHALKAARDAVNTRVQTPGHFLFLGTGSHKSLVADMASRRSQPFAGAMSVAYEPLGDDFVKWKLSLLADVPGVSLPDERVACEGFSLVGQRPEELQKALLQLQSQPGDPNFAFPIICATLANAAADVEFATLSAISELAEVIFDRLALSDGGGPQLFSGAALALYSTRLGTPIQVVQVQNTLERMIAANLVVRQGHGVYIVADPLVREIWRLRYLDLTNPGRAPSSPQ